jgi:ABC-type oligopeptide transport system ATPase subunit
MIIGINGKIGSGKDTVGKIIQYLQCHNTGEITIQDVMSNPEHEWWLEEQSKFEIKKFAGKLKEIASLLTGIDIEDFEDQEFKKTNLESSWDVKSKYRDRRPPKPMTVREFLQKLGTEAMREGLHTNVWVNALFADYKPPKMSEYNPSNWIITDMRFPNEMDAVVKRHGITIRVTRPVKKSKNTPKLHSSETALDKAKFDYEIINDGSMEKLVKKVRKILIKEELI